MFNYLEINNINFEHFVIMLLITLAGFAFHIKASLHFTFVKMLFWLLFRARLCVRNSEFDVAIDSRIFAVRASRAHGVHYVSTAERPRQSSPVRRPENMSFISQDDSLFPLFYFYGGSVSRSIAPTRKQIYRAAVLASHSQYASKAACGSFATCSF